MHWICYIHTFYGISYGGLPGFTLIEFSLAFHYKPSEQMKAHSPIERSSQTWVCARYPVE